MSDWPAALRGVTETVTTTLGPNDRWNAAALGVHAGDPATATTFGRTRTRRNFRERGEAYVQFTRDPVLFAEAALGVHETADPVLDAADAWARVAVERVSTEERDGTSVATWALRPVETGVLDETVPTTNRGFGAVIEATVAASRLDVAAYDTDRMRARLAYFADVVDRCGGERERAAMARVRDLTGWEPPENESF